MYYARKDDGSQAEGKKRRRLNMEQVKTREKSFELGNKLEPERKMQLARALGLHPKQVAIWFQNRRARWKTSSWRRTMIFLKANMILLRKIMMHFKFITKNFSPRVW
ncbi:unnamed protein product [Lupinus luteus]|uniref:Homeobox-leucine zipper protein n=1 Tax=Lupinus luteus TaxID=3873 RepID=A0AAV1WH54_LUPLU